MDLTFRQELKLELGKAGADAIRAYAAANRHEIPEEWVPAITAKIGVGLEKLLDGPAAKMVANGLDNALVSTAQLMAIAAAASVLGWPPIKLHTGAGLVEIAAKPPLQN